MKRLTALLLALLMMFTLTGCYTAEEYQQAIAEAKDTAYAAAKTEWYDVGFKEGKSEGFEAGREEGLTDGYESGYATGYAEGKNDGRDEGYDQGYAAGKEAGKSNSGGSSGGGGGGGGTGGGGGGNNNDDDDITVYVTKTGEKYHYSWCGYLHSSKIAKSLSSAKSAGYTPCSRCNPPS